MPAVASILEQLKNGTSKVSVTDSTNRLTFLRASRIIDSSSYTLASDTVTNNREITVSDATGLNVGDEIALILGNGSLNPSYYYGVIKAIATNTLTMDLPIDRVYPTATTLVYVIDTDLNINANATTPTIASAFNASANLQVNLKRVMFHITDGDAMDDTKFGGIAELTYGVGLRKKNADGTYINYFNVTTNGELRELAYDLDYPDKAGAGLYGMGCRLTFTKLGSPIVLEEGEELEVVLQDDLSGLSSFRVMFEGELVPIV